MRDAVHAGLGGMDGERRSGAEAARESAAFDVTVEDYRRAFAYAIATSPEPRAPRLSELLAEMKLYWLVGAGVGVLSAALWAFFSIAPYGDAAWSLESPHLRKLLFDLLRLTGTVVVVMVPVGLLTASALTWDARGARRRFPAERAAWKRPGRMRVGWGEAGLVLVGEEGFGSFGWNQLHAWLDAPGELVIFTGVYDPVPVPHAALAADDLDDLRHRLFAAEVPQAWRPMSGEELGLKRVFD